MHDNRVEYMGGKFEKQEADKCVVCVALRFSFRVSCFTGILQVEAKQAHRVNLIANTLDAELLTSTWNI